MTSPAPGGEAGRNFDQSGEKRAFFFTVLALAAADQGVKLLVFRFLRNGRVFVFGDLLKLKVVRNESSMALLSVFGVVFPPFLAVCVKLAVLALVCGLLFFLGNSYGKSTAWRVALTALCAGCVCAVLDSAVWKSTVDFLDFASSFAIDLKDIYLDVGCVSLFVYAVGKRIWLPRKAAKKKEDTP